ncbi:MAG: hypothetical protein DCC68_18465 [Planctomycetota bacterium]|nr:MAG: hypothetical protein DCC68_18465 [Planctomycetota bacterium]
MATDFTGGPARLAAAAKKRVGWFFNAEGAEDAQRPQREDEIIVRVLRASVGLPNRGEAADGRSSGELLLTFVC